MDGFKLPIASDVVFVGVGIEDDDGQADELGGHLANVAHAHASVEEHRLFSARMR